LGHIALGHIGDKCEFLAQITRANAATDDTAVHVYLRGVPARTQDCKHREGFNWLSMSRQINTDMVSDSTVGSVGSSHTLIVPLGCLEPWKIGTDAQSSPRATATAPTLLTFCFSLALKTGKIEYNEGIYARPPTIRNRGLQFKHCYFSENVYSCGSSCSLSTSAAAVTLAFSSPPPLRSLSAWTCSAPAWVVSGRPRKS
jgi:hypothetical protein